MTAARGRGSYGDLRARALQTAWDHLRHLLKPETVHLLKPADLAEALAVAGDILTEAEGDLQTQLSAALERLRRAETDLTRVNAQRDTALRVADQLAYGVAGVLGVDIGRHQADNNPWAHALGLIDEMAVANRSFSQHRKGGASCPTKS